MAKNKKGKKRPNNQSTKIQKQSIPASNSPKLTKEDVIQGIKENAIDYTDTSGLNPPELEKINGRINLICKYLTHDALQIDSCILRLFTLHLSQEENILYNFSYFSDKIPSFLDSINKEQKRLDEIIDCFNGFSQVTSLSANGYTIRFDEFYDFFFNGSIWRVKVDMSNISNFTLHTYKTHTLRILENDTTKFTKEYRSLNEIALSEIEKTIEMSKRIIVIDNE